MKTVSLSLNLKRFTTTVMLVSSILTITSLIFAQTTGNTPLNRYSTFPSGHAQVNWQKGYIDVRAGASADIREMANTGQAKSVALKTARHLAYEKLVETVYGLNLTANATYREEIMADSTLKTATQGLIKGARVVREDFTVNMDGSPWAEITLRLQLQGAEGLSNPVSDWAMKQPAVESYHPFSPTDFEEEYTGVIVDATGLGARPAMVARLLAGEDQRVVYGPHNGDRETAMNIGYVAYASSVEQARTLERTGENPLVVRAIAVVGKKKADLVISEEDAITIYTTDMKNGFLKDCKVVLVLD